MKKKLFCLALGSLIVLSLAVPSLKVSAASPTPITIDEDEYNLYTDNFPDPIGDDVFAKFTTPVSDADDYYLYFDQDVAESSFKTALDKNRISYDEDYICYMKTILYKVSDEDDDQSVTNQKMEIYFPLPMDAQDHPEDCTFYKLSSGKLTPVFPLDLYSIDDINYIKLTIASSTDYSTIYGFVYPNPEDYDEEDDEDDDDDDDWYDEDDPDEEDPDEEDPDEEDPTATPSPTPTAKLNPTATPTAKPTASPTPKPTSGGSSQSGSTGGSSGNAKDTIPKTGDDFPLGTLLGLGGISVAALIFCVVRSKKS